MKINSNNLIKFDVHLGRWKKSIKDKNELYYYSRSVNTTKDIIKNVMNFQSFFKNSLISNNKIIFLNKNSILEELVENLAIETSNIYTVPTNFGYFSNTKLYDGSLKSFKYWGRNYSAAVIFDEKGLETFVKEFNYLNIPVFSLNSSLANYWVSESTVSINIWLFYFMLFKNILLNNNSKKNKNNIKLSERLIINKNLLIRNKIVLTSKFFKIKTKWELQRLILTKIKKAYVKKRYKQKTLKKKI